MPQITALLTGNEAVALWILSTQLKGDDSQFRARERIRAKIDTLFPESKAAAPNPQEEAERQTALTFKRELTLTGYEQTAMAEGLLKYLKQEDLEDAQKKAPYHLAKICRVANWLNEQIDKTKMEEFTHSDDAVISDPEPLEPESK
jgi:hypothetical protein